ncbi:MAG: hypothetical protein Tsb002_14880 [Wenzhouxiangellaceae bacterium]
MVGWHGWHHLGNPYDYVNGIGFYCSSLEFDGTGGAATYQSLLDENFPFVYVNTNGSLNFSACGTNEFVTGVHGRAGSYIDQVGVYCSDYVDAYFGWSTQQAAFGGGGGSAFTSKCPASQMATGAWVHTDGANNYVGAIQLQCSPMVYAPNEETDSDLDGIRDLEEHEECHDDDTVSCYANHRVLSEAYAQVLDESFSHAQTLPEYDSHLSRMADGTLDCDDLIGELVQVWNASNPGNTKQVEDHYGPCPASEDTGVVVYSGTGYSGDGTEIAPAEYGNKFLDWASAASRQASSTKSFEPTGGDTRAQTIPVSSVRSVKVPNGSDFLMCIVGPVGTRECQAFSASHPDVMSAFTLDNQVSTSLSYLAVEVTDYASPIKIGLLMGYLCGGNLDNDINNPAVVDQIINGSDDCPNLSMHEQLIDVNSLHQVEKFRARQFFNPFGHSEVTLSTAQCLNAFGQLENCFDANEEPRSAVIRHKAPSVVAGEQNRYLVQVDQSVNGLSPGLYYRFLPAGVDVDAVDENTAYEMAPTQNLSCLTNNSCTTSVFDENNMRLIGLVTEQPAGSNEFYIRNKCTLRPDASAIDSANISTIIGYSTLSETMRVLLSKLYFDYSCDYDSDYVNYIASQQQDTSNAAYWGNFAMSLTHAAEDIGLLLAADALLSPAVAYAWTAYGESLLAATGVTDLVASSELIAGLVDLAPYAGQITVAGITMNQTIQDGIRYSQCTTNSCRAEARTSLILDAYFIGDFAKNAFSAREPHPFDPPSNTLTNPLSETDQILSDQADIFMADVRDEVQTSRRFDGLGCGGFTPGTLTATRSSASCQDVMDGWESDGLSDVSSVADAAEADGVTANEAAAIRARLPDYRWNGSLQYSDLSGWDLSADLGVVKRDEGEIRSVLDGIRQNSSRYADFDLERIQIGTTVDSEATHGVTVPHENAILRADPSVPIQQRIDLSPKLFQSQVNIDNTLYTASDPLYQFRVYDTTAHELNHAIQNEFWPKAFRADIFSVPGWPAGNALREDFLAQIHKAAKSLMELDSYYLNETNMNLLSGAFQDIGVQATNDDIAIMAEMATNTELQLQSYSADLRGTTVGSGLNYDANNVLPRSEINNGLTALANHTETFYQTHLQGKISQDTYNFLIAELQRFRNGL